MLNGLDKGQKYSQETKGEDSQETKGEAKRALKVKPVIFRLRGVQMQRCR